ncbi:hypothetical protein D9M68_893020 [compost metagenome]
MFSEASADPPGELTLNTTAFMDSSSLTLRISLIKSSEAITEPELAPALPSMIEPSAISKAM